MKYQAPPNMYDVLPYPPSSEPWFHTARWRYVEGVFRELCRRFGYREIRTPILEQTELFARHIGEATDIVSKEMFSFIDLGGRSMTLKPEGTAPAVRACIEHNLFAEHPILKLYYIGQNFRYEHGQKGRYRQHQQLGIEVFGVTDPAIDAEVILLAMEFYRELGVSEQILHLNSVGAPESRARYKEALKDYVRPFLTKMSQDGQRRFEINPLRMLDTKDDNDLRLLENAPILLDYLDAECRDHFEKLQSYLSVLGVDFRVDPRLVRGFDYYTKTAFEIKSKSLGAQDTLCGGGRYDGLVEECGGPPTPGIGFGMGIERCLITLDTLGITLPLDEEQAQVFLITLGAESLVRPVAVKLLGRLRAAGFASEMDYQGRSLRKQMKRADDLGARFVLIMGEDEVTRGNVALRDQNTKEQREISLESVVEELNRLFTR